MTKPRNTGAQAKLATEQPNSGVLAMPLGALTRDARSMITASASTASSFVSASGGGTERVGAAAFSPADGAADSGPVDVFESQLHEQHESNSETIARFIVTPSPRRSARRDRERCAAPTRFRPTPRYPRSRRSGCSEVCSRQRARLFRRALPSDGPRVREDP